MKKLLIGLIAAIAVVCVAQAVTVTNMGQVITVTTLEEVAASTADLDVVQDQSFYPAQPGQIGTLVRFYNFAVDGGSTAVTLKGGNVPDNITILDGYIDVVTAVTPITATTNVLTVGSVTIGTLDSVSAGVAVLALNGNDTTNAAAVVSTQAVAPTAGVWRVTYRCITTQ